MAIEMNERVKLDPNPGHPITIEKNPRRVVVKFDGMIVADSTNVLSLKEASYPPVQYVPREDVNMAMLTRSPHTTYCPYKGDASYFHLTTSEATSENAVWTYETPYDAVAPIKGHVAFYPNRVDITEI